MESLSDLSRSVCIRDVFIYLLSSTHMFPSCIIFQNIASCAIYFMHLLLSSVWLSFAIGCLAVDIKDRYIVLLKPGTDILSHLSSLHDISRPSISHITTFSTFISYTLSSPSPHLFSHLQTHSAVLSLSPETVFRPASLPEEQLHTDLSTETHLSQTTKAQFPAPCALSLLSHRHVTCLSRTVYTYLSPSPGTYAYVLDSGVNIQHLEFGGRVVAGYDATPPSSGRGRDHSGAGRDDIGHGTQVAGLIASRAYGVAKGASIISVKVINHEGEADSSSVIEGLGWAVGDILSKNRRGRAVVLTAFNGLKDEAVERAVSTAVAEGISVVLAAGNIDVDARYTSPAGAEGGTIVVSATDKNRKRWRDANWGPGVDIFALGVDVRSLSARGTTGTLVRSGTSLAAGLVAGLVLYLKAMEDLPDARTSRRRLLGLATRDVVKDAKGSRNLFAYNGSGK